MATVTLHDLLRHVCPICGDYKPASRTLCDAHERDRYVESKQTRERMEAANAVLDEWERT